VKRLGRSTQGVIVMRLREAEQVVALAPVVEADGDGVVGVDGMDDGAIGVVPGEAEGTAEMIDDDDLDADAAANDADPEDAE
jgi:hypothetical protein